MAYTDNDICEILTTVARICEHINSECGGIAYEAVAAYHRAVKWCLANDEFNYREARSSLKAVWTNAEIYLTASELRGLEQNLA